MAGYASGLIQALRGNSSAPAASANPGVSLFSPEYQTAAATPSAPKRSGMALSPARLGPAKLFNPGNASDFVQNKNTVIEALRANPQLDFSRDTPTQSNLSDAQWGAVKELRDNYGWTNPFDAAGAKALAGVALAATGSPVLGGALAYDQGKYQTDFINNYLAMDSMQKALMADQAAAQQAAAANQQSVYGSDPTGSYGGGWQGGAPGVGSYSIGGVSMAGGGIPGYGGGTY